MSEHLEGVVERITFYNAENGYTVLRLRPNKVHTGSYLAACVFYATFYNKSPEGLPAHIAGDLVDASGTLQTGDVALAPADALFLQQMAWMAVSNQPRE